MNLRLGLYAAFFVLFSLPALAQTQPQPRQDPAGPDQPVRPQTPSLAPRTSQQPAAQPNQPPFVLTPQEQAQVDQVLAQWEKRNNNVKTFDCLFKRWTYDVIFGPPGQAKYVDVGVLRYKAPDRGSFEITTTVIDGNEAKIEDSRAEHWVCDGKSIFEFNPVKKQVIEHKLPPEMQGKAIADSPLPFLFGAQAKKLQERYYIRLIPSPHDPQSEVCLEAYPRTTQAAGNFHHTEFLISAKEMLPYALKLVQPNEKDYTVYQFYETVVDDPFRLFKTDPFRPSTPIGWQRVVAETPTIQANRPPSDDKR